MRKTNRALISMIVAWMLLAAASAEATTTRVRELVVLPFTEDLVMVTSQLVAPATLGHQINPPLHGGLVPGVGTVTYKPHKTFWTIGVDSFTISSRGYDGERVVTTVYLIAGGFTEPSYQRDFEDYEGPDIEDSVLTLHGAMQRFARISSAAISGEKGVRLDPYLQGDAWMNIAPLQLRIPPDSNGTDPGQGGSCVRSCWDPTNGPPPDPIGGGGSGGGPNGPAPGGSQLSSGGKNVDGVEWVVLSGGAGGVAYLEVRMRRTPEGVFEVRAAPTAATPASFLPAVRDLPWIKLDEGPQMFALSWWSSAFHSQEGGGYHFLVNGRPMAHVTGLSNADWRIKSWDVGQIATDGPVPTIDIDDVRIFKETTEAGYQVLRTEPFEQPLGGYPTVGGQNLEVVKSASISGLKGLAVHVGLGGETNQYLIDNAPAAKAWTGMRFRFDPNSIQMPNGTGFVIFGGANQDGLIGEHIRVWLQRNWDRYEIRASVHERSEDDGTPVFQTTDPPLVIGDEPVTIEMVWQQSMADTRAGGRFNLWIDGQMLVEFTQLDTNHNVIESFRMGAAGSDTRAAVGTIHFDDLQIWAQR